MVAPRLTPFRHAQSARRLLIQDGHAIATHSIDLLSRFVDFENLSARLVGGVVSAQPDLALGGLGCLVQALVGNALSVQACRFLHQRTIFLRL